MLSIDRPSTKLFIVIKIIFNKKIDLGKYVIFIFFHACGDSTPQKVLSIHGREWAKWRSGTYREVRGNKQMKKQWSQTNE